MKVAALTACLVLTALAGCLSSDDSPDGTPAAPRLSHTPDAMAAASAPYTTFLCRDGYRLASDIASGAIDRCNHRVTKPLLDPEWFNVTAQHGPANEVSIAVNPTDPLNAAGGGKDYTVSYVSDDARCGQYTVWMGTYWTHDGGLTWGNDLMPGFAGDTRASSLHGQHCNTDPVLAFDDDGTLWYQSLNYVGERSQGSLGLSNPLYPGSQNDLLTGSQIYFTRSTDGGASYGAPVYAVQGDGDQVFHDKQWFALQPGGDHMIATWSLFTGTPPIPDEVPTVIADLVSTGNDVVMFVESFDDGATWSAMKPFPLGPVFPLGMQFSMPQYLPGAAVGDLRPDLAVLWASFTFEEDPVLGITLRDTWDLAYTEGTITPFGTVFAPPQAAFTMNPMKSLPGRDGTGPSHFRSSTYPVLAVDTTGGEHDGRRYVVWADQPGAVDTDVQVLLRWSDDGDSWSAPIVVNDEPQGDQFMPWIDIDPEGGLHMAWYDRRGDPTNERIDVYYAYSDDGGASFHPNVRVTETDFNGDLGHHQSGAPFIGDYIGVDATTNATYILWADTRHTGQDGGGRPAGSDVYSATLLRDVSDGVRAAFDPAFQ